MTAETLGGPFLTHCRLTQRNQVVVGWGRYREDAGVVFANKEIRVTTMRDGKVSTLSATGPQLIQAMEKPENAPVITSVPAALYGKGRGENWRDTFPDGHGTHKSKLSFPNPIKDPSTGEQVPINFRTNVGYGASIID